MGNGIWWYMVYGCLGGGYVVKYGGMCILRNGGKAGNEDQSEPQGGAGGVTAGR